MKTFTLGFEAGRRFKDNGAVYELIERGLTETGLAPAENPAETLEDLLPEAEPFRAIARGVAGGEVEEAAVLVRAAVKEGWDGMIIATDGLLQGMDVVSTLYNRKQAYVPEILLAARALEAGLALCGDLRAMESKGTVLIHTANGDLHDIGKNIVAAIVAANGYRVIDLGTSVPAERVIAEVKKNRPVAVLGSSLMTSTRGAFLETADRLLQEGIEVPLIVGGGACDGAFASQRENTRYARDPAALVGVLDEMARERGK
jgi:methanol corrinoid protein